MERRGSKVLARKLERNAKKGCWDDRFPRTRRTPAVLVAEVTKQNPLGVKTEGVFLMGWCCVVAIAYISGNLPNYQSDAHDDDEDA